MNVENLIEINNLKKENLSMTKKGKKYKVSEMGIIKMRSYGPISLNINPTYLKEIHFNDRIINLNSSFLNVDKKDRLKLSLSCDYNLYYKASKIMYFKSKKCFSMKLKAQKSSIKGSDYYDHIQYAIEFYNSLNNMEANKFALILENMLQTLKMHTYPDYLTEEKTMLKSISQKTKKWIENQNYLTKTSLIDHYRNIQTILQVQFSHKLINFLGFDVKKYSEKKLQNLFMNLPNYLKSTNSIEFNSIRYLSIGEKFKNSKIEMPERLHLDNVYFETSPGNLLKIVFTCWTERWTKHNLEYIRYYYVINPTFPDPAEESI